MVILDDPLSAVDSHGGSWNLFCLFRAHYFAPVVSAHLIEQCLLGMMKHKTRLLAIHHLGVAQHADLIIVMDRGRIIQQGTYEALRSMEGTFQTLMDEYGVTGRDAAEGGQGPNDLQPDEPLAREDDQSTAEPDPTTRPTEKAVTKIHLDEEIFTGGISGKTWTAYLKALHKGEPFRIALSAAVLAECVSVALTLLLGFWTTSSIPGFEQSDYRGWYAGLGVAMSFASFGGTYATYLCALGASFLMAQQAFNAVLRSPVSFHDRTPSGRVISRLTKDIEVLDDQLSDHLSMLLGGILSIIGTIGLVFYTFPYLGLVFIPMFAVYFLVGKVYARTARQLRRINSTTRSYVYSQFGEQLSGLMGIRAYRQERNFTEKFRKALDNEGRFFYVIGFMQHWLCLRLDLLGSLLILGIGVFGVCYRNEISPAKVRVVLIYAMQTTQASVSESSLTQVARSKPCFRQLFSDVVVTYTRLERGKTETPWVRL